MSEQRSVRGKGPGNSGVSARTRSGGSSTGQSSEDHLRQAGPLLEVGIITRPHGVHGGVVLQLHNPASSAMTGRTTLVLDFGEKKQRVSFRPGGPCRGGMIIFVRGVADPAQAEKLRGAKVLIERETLEPLQEGEYLYVDLLGCRILDEHDHCLGLVVEIFEAGASDVLVVQDGKRELMIPLVDPWVREVDLQGRTVHISGGEQWMELAREL